MQTMQNCSTIFRKIQLLAAIWTCAVGTFLAPFSEVRADEKALTERVEQLAGLVTRDPAGQITAVNLDNRPTTDADLPLFATAPNLQKLTVWGAGITDAGANDLLALKSLTDLGLLNTQITDAGLAKVATMAKLKGL